MSLLLESIYFKDGEFRNVAYHEARMQRSSKALFDGGQKIDLTILEREPFPSEGLFKVRVVYDTQIRRVEYVPYEIRLVGTLKLIYNNDINYAHKFLDRTELENLNSLKGNADDILIVKNGLITDSVYANVIFKRGMNWFTPTSYLLNGTMRQSLLDTRQIMEEEITIDTYRNYDSCKLINAMLGMEAPQIPMEAISR